VAVGGTAELGSRSGLAALLGFLATFLGAVVVGAGVASARALLRSGTRP
jgi:hypothetical protein